uniref:C2H2-type domain-containing protein n=1 Tax=Schistocephalus solidus TaxID=70667 RepID=A0A183THN0_SCHSO
LSDLGVGELADGSVYPSPCATARPDPPGFPKSGAMEEPSSSDSQSTGQPLITHNTYTGDGDLFLNCPHRDCTITLRIGLVGHLRIHRTETGEPVPGAPTHNRHRHLHCPHCPHAFTHRMGLFGYMRIHDSGIHRNADNTDIPCTPSVPAIITATATPTTTNHIPSPSRFLLPTLRPQLQLTYRPGRPPANPSHGGCSQPVPLLCTSSCLPSPGSTTAAPRSFAFSLRRAYLAITLAAGTTAVYVILAHGDVRQHRQTGTLRWG